MTYIALARTKSFIETSLKQPYNIFLWSMDIAYRLKSNQIKLRITNVIQCRYVFPDYQYFELILDGNLEIGAHVRSYLCYLSGLRHLFRWKAVNNRFFSPKTLIFLHACATCSELPSSIITMSESMLANVRSLQYKQNSLKFIKKTKSAYEKKTLYNTKKNPFFK